MDRDFFIASFDVKDVRLDEIKVYQQSCFDLDVYPEECFGKNGIHEDVGVKK